MSAPLERVFVTSKISIRMLKIAPFNLENWPFGITAT